MGDCGRHDSVAILEQTAVASEALNSKVNEFLFAPISSNAKMSWVKMGQSHASVKKSRGRGSVTISNFYGRKSQATRDAGKDFFTIHVNSCQ